MFRLVAVSLVVMALSHIIAKERLFEPIRRRCGGKASWLGYLLSCPYCASHWVAFVLVPICGAYYLRPPYAWGWLAGLLDWFLSSVLVAAIAAFLRVGFYFIDERQGLLRREERKVEREADLLDEELGTAPPPQHH